jgi:predicted ATPase
MLPILSIVPAAAAAALNRFQLGGVEAASNVHPASNVAKLLSSFWLPPRA